MHLRALLLLPLFGGCAGVGRVGYQGEAPIDAEARFDRFLDELQLARMDRDAGLRARIGLPPRPGWPDATGRGLAVDAALTRHELDRLEGFSPATLGEDQRLSHRLLAYEAARRLERLRWQDQTYLALPGEGPTTTLAGRLIGDAPWSVPQQAEAWILRARDAAPWLDAMTERLDQRAGRGLLAPRQALVAVADEGRRLLSGRPIEPGAAAEGSLMGSFRARLGRLSGLEGEARDDLLFRAQEALVDELGPALGRWVARVQALAEISPEDRGVWALPEGEAWYASILHDTTSLSLSAAALHRLGLQEVERLHDRFTSQQVSLGRPAGLAEFFRFLREDPAFLVAPDETGRAALAGGALAALEVVEAGMDHILRDAPRQPFTFDVAAQGYRAGPPALVGLGAPDPSSVPAYLIPARAARLGLPGRHLREQITRARADRPGFRHTLDVSAWGEGWDLYAAALPIELGLTDDPYPALGVLVEELWAACLLVVDTGLHHERWTPDRARDWLITNSPSSAAAAAAAVDHLLTHPGAATAAPVGCLRLRELRWEARQRLGNRFDLADFHRVVLDAGPLPLGMLEQRVEAWVPAR